MTDIKLRPYQQDFIDAVRNEFLHNNKRVVGVAPCGAGKTIITGWMIKQALCRNKKAIFFVHRKELIAQTSKTFTDLDIPHGIISADSPMNINLPVQIASVQTLAKRLNSVPAPDFLICDECHHILANTYKKVLDAFPDAFLLGVTATPLRMGDISLVDSFDSMVLSLSVDQLINLGNLTPFKYFAPKIGVDLHNVRSKFGEFVNSDLERELSNKKIFALFADINSLLKLNLAILANMTGLLPRLMFLAMIKNLPLNLSSSGISLNLKNSFLLLNSVIIKSAGLLFNRYSSLSLTMTACISPTSAVITKAGRGIIGKNAYRNLTKKNSCKKFLQCVKLNSPKTILTLRKSYSPKKEA